MADILEDCAADPSHQPAIYAAFIREIVRKTKESRTRGQSNFPSRAASPGVGGGGGHGGGGGMGAMLNGTIDPNLTSAGAGAGGGPTLVGPANGSGNGNGNASDGSGVYDPALLEQAVAWSAGDMEAQHFHFIPQGGDMM
jgi:hypothetical protein